MSDAMEERKRELHRQLAALQADYQRAAEPIIKLLVDIQACERPAPVVFPDGRVIQYIGPLPTWKGEGGK